MSLSWDEEVPHDIKKSWQKWILSMSSVGSLSIPRCLKPVEFDDAYVELHHFADASEHAYGACSYLRFVNHQGRIHTALVWSKAKVAPLKPMTIPRLELEAAVLAARADSQIRRGLDFTVDRSHFWSDSQIVLGYIKNSSKRFKTFVANRVGEIRCLTEVDQWSHVTSKSNPADLISRGVLLEKLPSKFWLQGPEFLQWPGSAWKSISSYEVGEDDPEVKACVVVCQASTYEHPVDKIVNHCSSFYKAKKFVCYWLSFIRYLRSREVDRRSVSLMVKAEAVIIKRSQRVSYQEEIKRLSDGESVQKRSPISTLSSIVILHIVILYFSFRLFRL